MVRLSGVIERIVFRNEETHYTVARLRPNDDGRLFRSELVTLVGALPGVRVGEIVGVEGAWEAHPQHGRHLRVATCTPHAPVTSEGLKKYLGSGVIKGLGPKTAERIVNRFGEQTLAIIELEPERLTEAQGVGASMRDRIIAGWAEQREIRDLMLFLQSHEVSPGLAVKIYRQYGKDSLATIRENPYTLERDIYGVGFRTADTLAVKLGLPRDALPRLMTGLKHTLSEAASEDGHCYLQREELLTRAAALLESPVEALAPALEALRREKEVFIEEERVYLAPFFYAENGTARRLRLILKAPSQLPAVKDDTWEASFAELERAQSITLAESQRQAVRQAYTAKVSVLTGGPGVGKTTALRALLNVLEANSVRYCLAAPTGRAAKRMTEATGRPASTLHRLLEYIPANNDFGYNEHRPLPYQFVIVDEVSMLDILLAYRLVRAVAVDASLLLVGDADQLPSVGPGSVLRDVLASERVPSTHLTELFRQARESEMIVAAHSVNAGEMPALNGDPNGDFFFLRQEDPLAAQRLIVDLVARRLPARYGFDPLRDIQVLAPVYRGAAGVDALNEALQARLNTDGGLSVTSGARFFRAGDRVMQARNNYDKGVGGVFNGDLGRVAWIDAESRQVAVRFSDDPEPAPVVYEPHELDELTLAYACSIHRAQGSEYACVVLPLLRQHYLMLQRNLLYTAITRARRLCVIVGDLGALRRAVQHDALKRRNTGLAERLRGPMLRAMDEPDRPVFPALD
jgi:exodeoxyribonuclease V alpha subunit